MNATAHPASAPSRYNVGLGARLPPPTTGGRSPPQANGPPVSRPRPSARVAFTAGAVCADKGLARNLAMLSSSSLRLMGHLLGSGTTPHRDVEQGTACRLRYGRTRLRAGCEQAPREPLSRRTPKGPPRRGEAARRALGRYGATRRPRRPAARGRRPRRVPRQPPSARTL